MIRLPTAVSSSEAICWVSEVALLSGSLRFVGASSWGSKSAEIIRLSCWMYQQNDFIIFEINLIKLSSSFATVTRAFLSLLFPLLILFSPFPNPCFFLAPHFLLLPSLSLIPPIFAASCRDLISCLYQSFTSPPFYISHLRSILYLSSLYISPLSPPISLSLPISLLSLYFLSFPLLIYLSPPPLQSQH